MNIYITGKLLIKIPIHSQLIALVHTALVLAGKPPKKRMGACKLALTRKKADSGDAWKPDSSAVAVGGGKIELCEPK